MFFIRFDVRLRVCFVFLFVFFFVFFFLGFAGGCAGALVSRPENTDKRIRCVIPVGKAAETAEVVEVSVRDVDVPRHRHQPPQPRATRAVSDRILFCFFCFVFLLRVKWPFLSSFFFFFFFVSFYSRLERHRKDEKTTTVGGRERERKRTKE